MSYILLVEDNPEHAELVVRILKSQSYRVKHASRATIGLAMVRQECPSLILMDLNLPDMSGEMAVRVIRQQLGNRMPPIVAVTAYDDGVHRQSAKQVGCRAFIAKPVSPQELLHTARYFLEEDNHDADLTLVRRP